MTIQPHDRERRSSVEQTAQTREGSLTRGAAGWRCAHPPTGVGCGAVSRDSASAVRSPVGRGQLSGAGWYRSRGLAGPRPVGQRTGMRGSSAVEALLCRLHRRVGLARWRCGGPRPVVGRYGPWRPRGRRGWARRRRDGRRGAGTRGSGRGGRWVARVAGPQELILDLRIGVRPFAIFEIV